jgi:hypothetical protein
MQQVEVWVIVDEDGAYGVGVDADTAADAYESDHGGGHAVAKRVVQVTLSVPTPAVVLVEAKLPAL